MDDETKDLVKRYLAEGFMLQLATADANRPWASIVYFVADEKLNLYWVSKPDARHSKELSQNPFVAGSIPLDASPDKPNVGIQLEGEAYLVNDESELKTALDLYIDRFTTGKDYAQRILSGYDEHKMYRLNPKNIILIDEHHFKDNPRQQWNLE